MAQEIEITDEIRKKMAADNLEALKREGLNPDRVEPWEDGHRTADRDDAFEWWYFDAQLDDGSAVVITYSNKPNTRPAGPLVPTVLIMRRSPTGESKRETWKGEPDDFEASKDACDVRIGSNWVKGDLDTYELHAEAGDLSADFRISRESPSWRPGAAITYLDPEKKKYFAWVVPVPYGSVEGTVSVGGESQQVKGTVYHDHNWGNFMLAQMLAHWYWGRAHIGDFTIIFTQMTTASILGFGGIKLHVFFLSKGEDILTDDGFPLRLTTSDFVEGPGGRTYQSKLDFNWDAEEGSVIMTIRNPKMIEALDNLSDIPAVLRPLVHLVTNPYYYDFEADIELEVDLKGVKVKEKGRAIYEQMLFHKKASPDE